MATRKPKSPAEVPETPAVEPAAVKKPRAKAAKPAEPPAAEAKPKRVRKPKAEAAPAAAVSPEERYRRIAEAAYFIAEKRGFAPGDPTADWLAAEAQVDGK